MLNDFHFVYFYSSYRLTTRVRQRHRRRRSSHLDFSQHPGSVAPKPERFPECPENFFGNLTATLFELALVRKLDLCQVFAGSAI